MAIKWYSDDCPKCGAENFVCDGDPENLARSDVTGFRCRKCGEIWPLNESIKEIMPNWAEDVRDGSCLIECKEGKKKRAKKLEDLKNEKIMVGGVELSSEELKGLYARSAELKQLQAQMHEMLGELYPKKEMSMNQKILFAIDGVLRKAGLRQ